MRQRNTFTFISRSKRAPVMLVLLATLSAGCGGSGAGAPIAASAPIVAHGRAGTAATLNVSGQYHGMVKDSIFGNGVLQADLAQHQYSVGGVMFFIFGSLYWTRPATFLLSGRTLTGTGEIARPINGNCTASETATYTASRNLNGSYSASNGCSGETGTFTMKQQCSYSQSSAAEVNFGLKRCP